MESELTINNVSQNLESNQDMTELPVFFQDVRLEIK